MHRGTVDVEFFHEFFSWLYIRPYIGVSRRLAV